MAPTLPRHIRANIHPLGERLVRVEMQALLKEGGPWLPQGTKIGTTVGHSLGLYFQEAFELRAGLARVEVDALRLTKDEAITSFCVWWNTTKPDAHRIFGGPYLWANLAWEYPDA